MTPERSKLRTPIGQLIMNPHLRDGNSSYTTDRHFSNHERQLSLFHNDTVEKEVGRITSENNDAMAFLPSEDVDNILKIPKKDQ